MIQKIQQDPAKNDEREQEQKKSLIYYVVDERVRAQKVRLRIRVYFTKIEIRTLPVVRSDQQLGFSSWTW